MSNVLPPIYTVTLNPGLDRTLTVPRIDENVVLRAHQSQLDWGGKGFNVSRALLALGVPSVAMGLVGGFTGQMLTQGLHTLGIATDFVLINGETRTNTVIAEADSGRYIKVNEAGPRVDDVALADLAARIAARVTPGSYWALCGSLPPGAPAATYAMLIELIQARGGYACLDASGEALRLGCAAQPFLVKPNAEEAAEISGIALSALAALDGAPNADPAAARKAARHFCGLGAQQVALSLGAEGLLLLHGVQAIHARPPQVVVQTVVGVGDALLAGLLAALRQDLPPDQVARWGVAAGTAAAMTPGVQMGDLAQVQALAAQIVL